MRRTQSLWRMEKTSNVNYYRTQQHMIKCDIVCSLFSRLLLVAMREVTRLSALTTTTKSN